MYDNYKFGVIICCCCIIAKFISIMFYIASIVLSTKRRVPSKTIVDNEEEKVKDDIEIDDSVSVSNIHSSQSKLPIFLNPMERSWLPAPYQARRESSR